MRESDLENIAKIAVKGFWSVVKRNFPHVRSANVDPILAAALADAAKRAVLDWGRKNDRDPWTERGSVVRIRFVGEAEHGEKELLASVWDSDFATFRTWATIRPWSWELRHYHDEQRQDPGEVRLEFESQSGTWLWLTAKRRALPVNITHEDEASYKYACTSPDRKNYQVRELVCDGDHLLMEFPLHDGERGLTTRAAVDRLVGELNMFYTALTSG